MINNVLLLCLLLGLHSSIRKYHMEVLIVENLFTNFPTLQNTVFHAFSGCHQSAFFNAIMPIVHAYPPLTFTSNRIIVTSSRNEEKIMECV